MSIWGSHTTRKTGCGRQLQFVVPATPAPPPAPVSAAAEDEDVWGEDLPEGALEEAILLESQVLAPARAAEPVSEGNVWEDLDLEEMEPPEVRAASPAAPAAGVLAHETSSGQMRQQVDQLRRKNAALAEQVQAAKSERYTHQGEVAVLRSELNKRVEELESLRLDHQSKLQDQKTQFEAAQTALNKEVAALKSELQFKAHELSETSRQCRELRSPQASIGSPPRKLARVGASPELRKRFFHKSDFGKSEAPVVSRAAACTQTDEIVEDRLDCSEVAPSQLAATVLAAGGGADWLPGPALSALAGLSLLQDSGPGQVLPAAQLVVEAAILQLHQLVTDAEKLQTAAERDSRSCTLSSGRQWWAALLALLRQQRRAAAALDALTSLSVYPGLAPFLLRRSDLTPLLLRLLHPVTVQAEVRNPLVLEYSAAFLSSLAVYPLPETLLSALGPVLHEVLNTKPPARVLRALLQLLTTAAGAGQAAALWCPACTPGTTTAATGTCLLRKLGVLFSELPPSSDCERSLVSYSLPPSRRPRPVPSAHTPAHAGLRGELRPTELLNWQESTPPAVELASDPCQPWLRLVWQLVCRREALPSQPCCRANLSVLVVLLLYSLVTEHEAGWGDSSVCRRPVAALVSALRQLSDLDAAFSASVSRVRHQYVCAMDGLARCWRRLRLSPQTVGVLQELYKFEPGTFEAETADS